MLISNGLGQTDLLFPSGGEGSKIS